MERIIKELRRLGPLEPGEDRALVFDDVVVIVSFSSETTELKLKIVVGYHRIEGDASPAEATAWGVRGAG